MADKADVYVTNLLENDVNVFRKLPDGASDLDTVVAGKDGETVHTEKIILQGTDVSLEINAPQGMDIKGCPFMATSDVDLAVSHSRTDSFWTAQIVPNDLPPEAPTSVNITLGPEGP